MAHLGLAERREPTAGTWNLIEPYAETDAWQDWAASHTLIPDKQARIRFHLTPPEPMPNSRRRRDGWSRTNTG